ncbi:MAG TPA: hypothetical protein VHC45_07510 [Gaiellaceae bacterium]|nr:hypothetical protein [Gaiellaceae bacterium]HVV58195.1 hypothetical protein [Gaiellaceae bacterium]
MTLLALGRPFWPLFLHVFGAMSLFGATATAALLAWAAWRRPVPVLARSTFWSLLLVALPAWVIMRADGQWIYSNEGFSGDNDPSWLGIGFTVADIGLIVLLVSTGLAYWWQRSGNAVAARVVAGLTTLYLAALVVAWLAMSAKWN